MTASSHENGSDGVVRCDVAVVGAGPAGIAAATVAAESGASVVVIDQGARAGGQVWRHNEVGELPRLARSWLSRFDRSGARHLRLAMVVDATSGPELTVTHPGGGGTLAVRAKSVVLATGARELFIPYPGWTLPWVMGLGGAQALVKGGMTVRGKRVVVAGSGPLILPVAAAMAHAGARLMAVAEQAPFGRLAGFARELWRHPAKLLDGARYRAAFAGTLYRTGTWVARADGRDTVESVTLTDGRRRWSEECDLLCCAYGLVPNVDLACVLGCDVEDGRVVVDHLQRTTVQGIIAAGEPTGIAGEQAALAEGELAGLVATGRENTEACRRMERECRSWRDFGAMLATSFGPRDELRELADADTIVCRCEDVTLGRLDPSWSSRQAKLYTRVGMGPCQGAVCGPACHFLFGWERGRVRPPIGAPQLRDSSFRG